jgi:uncharacterized RDD family membrane protein YckC
MVIVIMLIFAQMSLSTAGVAPGTVALALPALAVLYRAVFEWSPQQATLGGAMTGVRIAAVDGTRISFPRALVRAVCEISFLIILLGMGHLAAAFNRDRRALHDVVAGTIAVDRLETSVVTQDAGVSAASP